MTAEVLTALLAERVMHWRVGPERFLIGDRRWLPRWRFQPAERLKDAFRLLEQAAPDEYSMGAGENGNFWVKVRVAGTTGEALESSKPQAIAYAIARAFGIDVDSSGVSINKLRGAAHGKARQCGTTRTAAMPDGRRTVPAGASNKGR